MTEKDFLARNMYPVWVKYVKKAKESIVVISPYVDNTVKDLLTNKYIDKNISISLITRVDTDTIFDKPYQIRALINCARKGIKIMHLDDLHAKLLIIDGKYLSIGSQNFTSRGKKNKETSMMSSSTFENSSFLNSINYWIDESDEIDLELLLKLEKGLKKFRPKIKKLRNLHKDEFDKISDEFHESKRNELRDELERQYQDSKLRFAAEYVYLSMTRVESNYSYLTTLLADNQYNLQQWKSEDEEGSVKTLVRLKYYPMINVENGALAFVRLASTRISSFLYSFYFNQKYIDNFLFKISVNCPKEDTSKKNLEFEFDFFDQYWNQYNAKLGYLYNGNNCKRVSEEFDSKKSKSIVGKLFIKSRKLENEFLQMHFKAVDLSTIGISIDNFLEGQRYKLYIVQHLENPILVGEKVW